MADRERTAWRSISQKAEPPLTATMKQDEHSQRYSGVLVYLLSFLMCLVDAEGIEPSTSR
jgi:hypothetical protein